MDNASIAAHFALLAKVMELHQENVFKIRSYSAVADVIATLPMPLSEMSASQMQDIPGIGSAIASKIVQLNTDGQMDILQKYMQVTPQGVIDMLKIKGLGVKKIWTLWKDLGIESLGELEYACKENRLIALKGFGAKTQENILEQISFLQQNSGKFLMHKAEQLWQKLHTLVITHFPEAHIQLAGELRMCANTISHLEIVLSNIAKDTLLSCFTAQAIACEVCEDGIVGHHPILWTVYVVEAELWAKKVWEKSSSLRHFTSIQRMIQDYTDKYFDEEKDIYIAADTPYVVPELRTENFSLEEAIALSPHLVRSQDIKGVVHTHTTYSDGQNTISAMADEAMRLGYQYLAISDHSKSAFYAQGLKEETVFLQHREIDEWNKKNIHQNFTLLKSIESDILIDGSLDYDADVLSTFDVVIASVHSILKMDITKATTRLIQAVENPYTHILGHLSGRLLLSRKGYPLDMRKIIDACASNNVVIELNANPHRLDIDAEWIPYCMEKNVKIAINPDAHNLKGINDIHYGVKAARRGGLQREYCINTFAKDEFLQQLRK